MERKITRSSRAEDRRKPRHREVFDTLLGEITSGRFQPGDRLPTEAELSKTFSASRATIARAMRDLKARGLLNRQRGGGTKIAQREDDGNRIALFAPFAQNASDLGFIGGQIHTHLSVLASQRDHDLRLHFVGRGESGGRRFSDPVATGAIGVAKATPAADYLDQMLAAADELIEKKTKGVLYYPVELPMETAHFNRLVVDKLAAAGLAIVLIDRDIAPFPQRSEFAVVTYDNRRAGYLVTDHMIKRGCKRIVFIGNPCISSEASDRMRGYCDALEANDLPADASLIREVNLPDLNAAFCRSIVEQTKPDGIICKTDPYAAVLGRHLMEMGRKIGQDIMLAGFDDEPIAEMLPVPLTTVRFPRVPFALVCYDRLIKQMENPKVPNPGLTLIDVELIARASTSGPLSHVPMGEG
jgi:DNA-binding LacI/PurR family transcriptional regulator/DNA-binding transcriptional regulator YhcF (GntR family)